MRPHRTPPTALSPRKRPSQARSERTVQLLLEGAARVLEERGLAGYTTNAVAERCGVSVGSLYQYFPNKDALMSALVLKAHLDTAEHLHALRTRLTGCPLHTAIEEMVRFNVSAAHAAPRLSAALEFEEDRLPRGAELEAAEAVIHGHVTALLRPYLASSVGTAHAVEATHRMIGIVQGMVDRTFRQPHQSEPVESAVARAVIGYLDPLLSRRWRASQDIDAHLAHGV